MKNAFLTNRAPAKIPKPRRKPQVRTFRNILALARYRRSRVRRACHASTSP